MDDHMYIKQHKTQNSKQQRKSMRSIGVNTESINNCLHDGLCPKIVLVPYLPYCYPICSNNLVNNVANGCMAHPMTPHIASSYNIPNPNMFHLLNNSKEGNCKCEDKNSVNLIHCCSSFHCSTNTNDTSTCNCTACASKNTVTVSGSNDLCTSFKKKNSKEIFYNKCNEETSDISTDINDTKHQNTFDNKFQPTSSSSNNTMYYTGLNNDRCCNDTTSEEIVRLTNELFINSNYNPNPTNKVERKIDDQQMISHLLQPTATHQYNQVSNTGIESDDYCVESDEATSSLDDDEGTIIQSDRDTTEDPRIRPENHMRPSFSMNSNLNNSIEKSSNLDMLMMLKAFVNQHGDNDGNSKLNQLINHLSTQENKFQTTSDSRKPLPRKKLYNDTASNINE